MAQCSLIEVVWKDPALTSLNLHLLNTICRQPNGSRSREEKDEEEGEEDEKELLP